MNCEYLPGEATSASPSQQWQRPRRVLPDSWGSRLQVSCSVWSPGWMTSETETELTLSQQIPQPDNAQQESGQLARQKCIHAHAHTHVHAHRFTDKTDRRALLLSLSPPSTRKEPHTLRLFPRNENYAGHTGRCLTVSAEWARGWVHSGSPVPCASFQPRNHCGTDHSSYVPALLTQVLLGISEGERRRRPPPGIISFSWMSVL